MKVHNLTEDAEEFTSNVYLATGDRNSLIDAGAMDGITDEISRHTDTLDTLVITHQHHDHISCLDEILGEYSPEIYSFDDLNGWDTNLVSEGDEFRLGDQEFRVLHTPGHADDHISLVGEDSLFSGDVVVYNDEAFSDGSFGRTDLPGQSRELLINSIEKLLKETPKETKNLYSGHGDIFRGNVREVIKRALERAEERKPKYPD